MKSNLRWIVLLIALSGIVVSIASMVGFLATILNNDLAWEHDSLTARDHYVAVGQSYTQGFTAGFFLCLCLVIVAVVIAARIQERRLDRANAHRQSQRDQQPAHQTT